MPVRWKLSSVSSLIHTMCRLKNLLSKSMDKPISALDAVGSEFHREGVLWLALMRKEREGKYVKRKGNVGRIQTFLGNNDKWCSF